MFLRYFPLLSPIVFMVVVAALGFVTPGYSHTNHTISRLAIEKFGWIQSLNMIQLAVGLYLTGVRFTDRMHDGASVVVIRNIFRICAIFLIIAAFFPTDPIENVPLDLSIISPTGLVHIMVVVFFLVLSPFGILKLTSILIRQSQFKGLGLYTLTAGLLALIGSIVWFIFYFNGVYLEYRGIFQKVIAVPVLLWCILINYVLLTKTKKSDDRL